MTWQFVVKQLLLPPGGLLIVFLFCWILRKKLHVLTSLLFWPTLTIFILMTLPATSKQLASILETEPALPASAWASLAQQADAIVILGGGRNLADDAWGQDQPSLLSQQRLRYGARLARASGLPILVSGGLHHGQPPSEAKLAASILSQDFAIEAKWREDFSRTTWENARFSADILHAEDIRRIVLVTDAWHMPRARWSFEQHGFEVIPAPQGFWSAPQKGGNSLLPDSQAMLRSSILLHEWLGFAQYRKSKRPISFSID